MSADLSFVIVTWNARATIWRCINSIFNQAPDAEVIVVDNNSADETASYVEQRFPSVHVIRNPWNAGFGQACNAGAALARGKYVCFLNPDAVLDANCITAIMETFETSPDIAICGPALRSSSGAVTSAGERFLTIPRFILRRVFGIKRVRVPECPAKVDWVSGAALFVSREWFEAAGGFDHRFWMYVEDMHLCWKANSDGLAVRIVPEASVTHDHATSARTAVERTLRSNAASTFLWFRERGRPEFCPVVRALLFCSLLTVGAKHCAEARSLRSARIYLSLSLAVIMRPSTLMSVTNG